jgi:DNA (cytosine-5)-methyltransferase 1
LIIDNRIIDFTPTTHIKGEVKPRGYQKMTPREARLQGFPDNYLIPVADASVQTIGNSVAVPATKLQPKK